MSSLLKQGLDNLQQYERRHCLVVDGIPPPYPGERENTDDKIIETLSASFEELNKNDLRAVIDKSHRIGPIRESKQSVIVRFNSHSARSKIYNLKKKSLNDKVKLEVSLTKERRDFIEKLKERVADIDEIEFPFADVNGDIRLLLKEKFRNSKTIGIKCMEELDFIVSKLDGFNGDGLYEVSESENEDENS